MKKLLTLIFIHFSITLFAQDNFVNSQLEFIVSENGQSSAILPAEYGLEYSLGKTLSINCVLDKSIKEYMQEYAISEEDIATKICIAGSGWSTRKEIFMDNFDPSSSFDQKEFNMKVWEEGNNDLLFSKMLLRNKSILDSKSEYLKIDIVLVNIKKGTILLLLASADLNFNISDEQMEKPVLAAMKSDMKKIRYEGDSFKQGELRQNYLNEVRDKFQDFNKQSANTTKGKDIKSFYLNVEDGAGIKYLSETPIIVTAELSNGKKLTTGPNGIAWEEFNVEVENATWENGILKANASLENLVKAGHSITFTISSVHQSEKFTKKYVFKIDYNSEQEYALEGMEGRPGNSGYRGMELGQRGQNGSNGERGGDGPEVFVFADLVLDKSLNQEVLKCRIVCEEKDFETTTYVGLNGKIIIDARGGTGGYGGTGGGGGDADNCRGVLTSGDGGDGGSGGDGGRGGKISLTLTAKAAKYQSLFVLNTSGGYGGSYGTKGFAGTASNTSGCPPPTQGNHGRNGYKGRDGMPGSKPVIKIQ